MKRVGTRFNTFLLLLVLSAGGGCETFKKKEISTLRVHLEVNPDGTERNGPVPVGQREPFQVNVEKQPFLTELHVDTASVVEALGGFQIMIQLNRTGTWLLEQYSTAQKGKRAAIYCQFGEQVSQIRWLAAPVMARRITDGLLVFTPDATREEADRIVKGLNQAAKEVKEGRR